ncbi:hypothetical protein P7K49_031175 [Saguinus oedipus]|uniref:Uncharacterized protein n=1 Tax=Saguinus oedipus TaxID=9490 RepID=A0ABQ9U4A6_SAGOE|nr:hypothetical protein P7K49_031175 [Saguinus oedipus]
MGKALEPGRGLTPTFFTGEEAPAIVPALPRTSIFPCTLPVWPGVDTLVKVSRPHPSCPMQRSVNCLQITSTEILQWLPIPPVILNLTLCSSPVLISELGQEQMTVPEALFKNLVTGLRKKIQSPLLFPLNGISKCSDNGEDMLLQEENPDIIQDWVHSSDHAGSGIVRCLICAEDIDESQKRGRPHSDALNGGL